MSQTELILNQAGGGGEEHVRRDGSHDDRVDVLWSKAPPRHQPSHCFRTHHRGGLTRSAYATLSNAGSSYDPVVGGIQPL
jgi:hypothetical protein